MPRDGRSPCRRDIARCVLNSPVQSGPIDAWRTRRHAQSRSRTLDWNRELRKVIPSSAKNGNLEDGAGLLLLFEEGRRPDSATLHQAVAGLDNVSISHDPAETDGAAQIWIEVVIDGLTFDIAGLSPGPPAKPPDFKHIADMSPQSAKRDFEAIRMVPGPHLAGGTYLLPILRGLLSLGSRLGETLEGLAAYSWPPSQALIGPQYFRAHADAWVDGGPFPSLVLTSFGAAPDGGLQSAGLSAFTGQELRIEPELTDDPNAAKLLGARLLAHLVMHGRVEATEQFAGPDGHPLHIEPSTNGKFVRVWRG